MDRLESVLPEDPNYVIMHAQHIANLEHLRVTRENIGHKIAHLGEFLFGGLVCLGAAYAGQPPPPYGQF